MKGLVENIIKVRIQNVYDEITEETKQELVIVKDRKTYIGALFLRKDPDDKLKKIIDEVVVDGSTMDVLLSAYNLKKKHDMIAKDDKTFKTMVHWQYVHGFSDDFYIEGYSYKDDTAYLAAINERSGK